MAWCNVRVISDAAHAEALADALMEAGALSATIEDADAGTDAEEPQFGEPGSPTTPGWKRSAVCALFEDSADVAAAVKTASLLAGLATFPAWTEAPVAEANWVQITQAQFEPIRVDERLWIVPSWHESPDPQAINIALDPGMAFGTGSHPTTHMCLQWLVRHVTPGMSLLDYGCGSGILAIAAAKLGAAPVLGVDIDPQAVAAARDNAESNDVRIRLGLPDVPLNGNCDVVVANILANPLRLLAPLLCGQLREGGQLLLSGLLQEQAEEISGLYAPWLTMKVAGERDGWVCLHGIRTS